MYFRAMCVLGVLCWGVAVWAVEVQRIGVAGFEDVSVEPEEVIGSILQNSLITELSRGKRFGVVFLSNRVTNVVQAREEGVKYGVDVVVYGSYRREGRVFVVTVKIYDLVENELRMSRVYRGEYSRNIFDTVDNIAITASEAIRRTLPPILTDEEAARREARRREREKSQRKPLYWEVEGGQGAIFSGYQGSGGIFSVNSLGFFQAVGVRVGWLGIRGMFPSLLPALVIWQNKETLESGIGFFETRLAKDSWFSGSLDIRVFFGSVDGYQFIVGGSFFGVVLSKDSDYTPTLYTLGPRVGFATRRGGMSVLFFTPGENIYFWEVEGTYFVSPGLGIQGRTGGFYGVYGEDSFSYLSVGLMVRLVAW